MPHPGVDLGQFYFHFELVGFGGTCVRHYEGFLFYSLLIHSLNSSCINLAEQYFKSLSSLKIVGFWSQLIWTLVFS